MAQSTELEVQAEYNFISNLSDPVVHDDKEKQISFVGLTTCDTQLEEAFWDSQTFSNNTNGIVVNFNGIGNNIWNYNKEDYIETLTGNRVSRKSILCGSQNIRLAGKTIIKPGVMIRGDIANINIGRYSHIGSNSCVRPSFKKFKGGIAYFPLAIGDYVAIEDNCVISAASIGSYVHIGKGSIISRRCIIKDCVKILAGSVVPPDTVIPPFTVYGGNPATYLHDLHDSFQDTMSFACMNYYDSMQLRKS